MLKQKKALTTRSEQCIRIVASYSSIMTGVKEDIICDPAVKKCPANTFRQEKSPDLSVEALCSRYLSSRAVARQVLSAYMSLTSVFGMGTGGPS